MRTSNKLIVCAGLLIGILFFLSYFPSARYLTYGSDEYYYIAMADSLSENGQLLDITSLRPQPPVTLQNGLPVVLSLLKKFGLDHYQLLVALAAINYLLWVVAAIPFYKLIKRSEIKSERLLALLVAGFLARGILLNAQVAPITDGIFNAGSILLIYLLYIASFSSDKKHSAAQWMIIFLLSAVLIHFSVRTFVYLIAAIIGVLIMKRFSDLRTVCFLSLALLSTGLSLYLSLLFIDTSLINAASGSYFRFFGDYLKFIGPTLFNLHTYAWSFMAGNTLGILSLMIVSYGLYRGIKNKNGLLVFLPLIFLSFVIVIFSLPSVKVLVQAAPRYIVLCLPIFWVICAHFKWTKYVTIVSIFISVVVAWIVILSYNEPSGRGLLYRYLREKNLTVPSDALLVSSFPRQSYVYLRGRHSNDDLCTVDLADKNKLWIAGFADFIDQNLARFRECQGVHIERETILTDDNPYRSSKENVVEFVFSQADGKEPPLSPP